MDVVRQQVTAEELLRMPDDGFRYELVGGELRKMTPAGNIHGRVAMNFGTSLNNHVKAYDLGVVYAAETGFKLAGDPDTVRAPDVAFVARERLKAVGEVEGFWLGAPDLAVEVISPGDSYIEVEEKVFDWLEAGTKIVVVVNPRKRSATVYRSLVNITVLTETDVLDGEEVLPGFRLAVQEIFA
ncbi:Uma2 family endonuclease [soil metagenome]|jgi:Uma2 family endonuclease